MTQGFTLSQQHHIPSQQIELRQFDHVSGGRHLHLANDDEHVACLIGFRTLPNDDCGLPHILEHIALCGSERFPVRDPFFLMLRRSLNTFMNAFTYPDVTCYPFATQNQKDFRNLLAVYSDAAFRPRLDGRDFAQEGWRLEPGEGENWQLQGVVYNEMKGAMASADAQMHQAIDRCLLNDTPYRWNSGGDPRAIPRLQHADLIDFHQQRYCAANAVVVTYGAIDLELVQQTLAEYWQGESGQSQSTPPLQPAADQEQQLDIALPLAEGQDPAEVAQAGYHWVLGDCRDPDLALRWYLLEQLLLGNPAAPLRYALEHSGLGRSIGHSGFDNSAGVGQFTIELDGCQPEQGEQLKQLIFTTLQDIAKAGLSDDDIDSALHQLEIAQRRIGGDGLPHGLGLCLRATMAWNHGVAVEHVLDQDARLQSLREWAADSQGLVDLIHNQLLGNKHRLWAVGKPDAGWQQAQDEAEAKDLQAMSGALNEPESQALKQAAEQLQAYQQQELDASVLPQLSRDDIPAQRQYAEGKQTGNQFFYRQATNGLLQQHIAMPLGAMAPEDLPLLGLATQLFGQLGCGQHDYRQFAALKERHCSSLAASFQLSTDLGDHHQAAPWLTIQVGGLARKAGDMFPLLAECWQEQRFDERERIVELLKQRAAAIQHRILPRGSAFALQAAQRQLALPAALQFELSGIGYLQRLRTWLSDDAALDAALDRMAQLWQQAHSALSASALIGDQAEDDQLQQLHQQHWQQGELPKASYQAFTGSSAQGPAIWTTASPVQYWALAFETVPYNHPDAAALYVASQFLTNTQLHPLIREQGGAYGGGAQAQSGAGVFALTSYRDPRLLDTVNDFRLALERGTKGASDDALHEALLSAVQAVDTPVAQPAKGSNASCRIYVMAAWTNNKSSASASLR